MLSLAYGCGLRGSEVVALKVQHVDGERGWLRVEQGKGAKDRLVTVSPVLMDELRRYWSCYRPTDWLFPHPYHPQRHLETRQIQRVYTLAKRAAGITKVGGLHSLRHAYATHQLERGLPVHELKRLLGHGHLETTMRYVHWLPGGAVQGQPVDLMAEVVAHD
jgi:integrase